MVSANGIGIPRSLISTQLQEVEKNHPHHYRIFQHKSGGCVECRRVYFEKEPVFQRPRCEDIRCKHQPLHSQKMILDLPVEYCSKYYKYEEDRVKEYGSTLPPSPIIQYRPCVSGRAFKSRLQSELGSIPPVTLPLVNKEPEI